MDFNVHPFIRLYGYRSKFCFGLILVGSMRDCRAMGRSAISVSALKYAVGANLVRVPSPSNEINRQVGPGIQNVAFAILNLDDAG